VTSTLLSDTGAGTEAVSVTTENVLTSLQRRGYHVARVPVDADEAAGFLLDIGRSLGELYVPKGCEPAEPLICTSPTRARQAAPFDRPEPIGWHGDFATYEDRPELSLVYITRPDPRGGDFGAWRLASVARVMDVLRASREGRASLDLLTQEAFPFSYADGEPPRWFKLIETRQGGVVGLRFYRPSLHRGCIAAYGEIPSHVAAALTAVERAADSATEIVPTEKGSLLVASNWFALHDRLRQAISRSRPNRGALLCFVARLR
jgi:hypothetical protein